MMIQLISTVSFDSIQKNVNEESVSVCLFVKVVFVLQLKSIHYHRFISQVFIIYDFMMMTTQASISSVTSHTCSYTWKLHMTKVNVH